jgi:hypothetical protein
MEQSPAIQVKRFQVERGDAINDGMPLPYVASLFKGTLPAWPGAVLLIGGSLGVAKIAQQKLEQSLGVPSNRIEIISIPDPRLNDTVNITISYYPNSSFNNPRFNLGNKQPVWVEFEVKPDKVEIEFEFSPDKALLEDIKMDWAPLKMLIKKHTAMGMIQNLKIGAKINSSISFDRETLAKVETSVKEKLKLALSGDVRLPGTNKPINIELYGAGGFKYKLNDGTIKPVFEGGVMLTVPFDFF